MEHPQNSPRVALLGAREDETELLAELHRQGRSALIGIYDPDPLALGLPLAEIMGIAAGSDSTARQRLAEAEYVVLPRDRMALRADVEWCSGLRAQLISLDEARQRWGRIGATPGARAVKPNTENALDALSDAGERLQSPEHLAEWLLDITMPAVGATGGSIQLLSATGDELYLVAGRGLSEHTLHNARRSVGEAVSGLVAATRRPQILHGEQHPHDGRDRDAIQSAISLPLELDDEVLIGVLNLSTSVHGQHFEETHVGLLQSLAPRCAVLLQQAQERRARQDREIETELVTLLDILDDNSRSVCSSLAELCQQTRKTLLANAVQLRLCRADGTWLPLAQDAWTSERDLLPPSDEVSDKILLDNRWQMAHRHRDSSADGDDEASLEHALERQHDSHANETEVLVPLLGTAPWGLLVAEFSTAAQAERFMHLGQAFIRDLGLLVESRLQQQLARERIEKLSKLAHALPRLIDALQDDRLPLELLEQTRELVKAQHVAFRRVDMVHRRYSPPMSLGVPEAEFEEWRKHDAHLTEETLKRREVHRTTLVANADDAPAGMAQRTHASVSLPIAKHGQLLGVLNVYDKAPQEPWHDPTFDDFDVDMLESMATILSELLPAVEATDADQRDATSGRRSTQ